LTHCSAVFVPGDPARTGRVAFWHPDGSVPPAVDPASTAHLTVVVPGDDGVEAVRVPAALLPVDTALAVRARGRAAAGGHRAARFWGAAALHALQLVARGLLLPGLCPADHDVWRVGPLDAPDGEAIRRLAAAMPREAHAVPL